MANGLIEEKSMTFAIRIVRLYKYLTEKKKEYVLSRQILRSGTSIGANVAEAEQGQTRKDFQAKMYIALKETAETRYWLVLLHKTDYLKDDEYQSILDDCQEIKRILSSITKTIKDKTAR